MSIKLYGKINWESDGAFAWISDKDGILQVSSLNKYMVLVKPDYASCADVYLLVGNKGYILEYLKENSHLRILWSGGEK